MTTRVRNFWEQEEAGQQPLWTGISTSCPAADTVRIERKQMFTDNI